MRVTHTPVGVSIAIGAAGLGNAMEHGTTAAAGAAATTTSVVTFPRFREATY